MSGGRYTNENGSAIMSEEYDVYVVNYGSHLLYFENGMNYYAQNLSYSKAVDVAIKKSIGTDLTLQIVESKSGTILMYVNNGEFFMR